MSAITLSVLCGHMSASDKKATKWVLISEGPAAGGFRCFIPTEPSGLSSFFERVAAANELHLCLSHGPALI